ncbi:protein of unknown function [Pseudomonas mediterranea]
MFNFYFGECAFWAPKIFQYFDV